MNNRATHILIEYESQDTTLLYRASDGLALACRQKITVISGDDPNPAKRKHQNFLDAAFAKANLRKLADQDIADQSPAGACRLGASFDERNGEPRIVPANENRVTGFKN